MHIQERFWATPKLEVNYFDDNISLIKIKNRSLFWPIDQSTSGLEWLYNELFYPFEKNHTSYSHPSTPIPVGGWVIDAGSCEVFFTMHAVEQGAKKILAIEPIPVNFEALKKNVA